MKIPIDQIIPILNRNYALTFDKVTAKKENHKLISMLVHYFCIDGYCASELFRYNNDYYDYWYGGVK